MPEASTRRRSFSPPWIIFWIGFGVRLGCILIGHTYRVNPIGNHWGFGAESGRIAQSLVEGRGYSSPFNGDSGPTAWLPPLFPLLMALAFKLFGIYTQGAALFVMACNSAFSAAIAPAIYEIAARCFDAYGIARRASTKAAPVALWSASLWAVYPAALQFAIHWLWEMSLSTCLFTWAFVFALRLRHTGEQEDAAPNPGRDFGRWAIFGLLWGLIALSNASLMLCLPASMLWILWPLRRNLTQQRSLLLRPLAGALLTCLVFAATIAPWVIRNERVFHAFVPTRSNLGVELWQSTHFYRGAFPWGSTVPMWAGDPEFKLFAHMGEVNYAKMRSTQAVARLHAHPGLFARYTLQRIQFFWFGVPHATEKHESNEVGRIFNYAFLSVAGLLGLGLALKRRVTGAWLLAFPFLLVPLAYYGITIQARFRHPIEPFIAIMAVYLFRSTSSRQTSV